MKFGRSLHSRNPYATTTWQSPIWKPRIAIVNNCLGLFSTVYQQTIFYLSLSCVVINLTSLLFYSCCWLIKSFTDPTYTSSIFVCDPLSHLYKWLRMYKVNYKVQVLCPNPLPIGFPLNFERCVPCETRGKGLVTRLLLSRQTINFFATSPRICKSTSIKHPNWRRTATFIRKQPNSRRSATSIRNQSNSRRTAASIRKQPNQRGRNTLEA